MEDKKKAISCFLEAFHVKPDIEKTKQDPEPNTYYHYEINATYENSSQLKVFRFVQSLHNFALFWNIPIEEFGLSEVDK